MRILIGGSSGLIGSALVAAMANRNYDVVRLVRRPPSSTDEVFWDPTSGSLEAETVSGFDAIVHLGGVNVASRRWTTRRKRAIRDSRLRSTGLLASAILQAAAPPKVFLCASAIGFYGTSALGQLSERSECGSGFLATLCREWESKAQAVDNAGVRAVSLRLGLVLSSYGGALTEMLPLFRMGLGCRLGNGRQTISWVSLDDVVGAIMHVIINDTLKGPVNIVSPHPATNRELTKALGNALGRSARLFVPATLLRLSLGQMANELLLCSLDVKPEKLLDSGYVFKHTELTHALKYLTS